MEQKEKGFKDAFDSLMTKDSKIVKDILMKRCKWESSQHFGEKMRGDRCCSKFSTKKVNEVVIVEATFRAFGFDAWTGQPTE